MSTQMTGWRPIDTAPQDNTPIQVTWISDWPSVEVMTFDGLRYFNINSGNYTLEAARPTHWRPMMEPPPGCEE